MNASLLLLQRIVNKPERLVLGLMSGTSLDGLDIALCKIGGFGIKTQLKVLAFKTINYPEEFKQELRSIFAQKKVDLEKLTLLNAYIGTCHAEMVLDTLKEWKLGPQDIDLIASHGQTIYHAPQHFHQHEGYANATLQIGDGDHIAVKTGILTLSDFRQKQVAAGGQGAPLAIYGDYLLFSSAAENRILLNLGGIANFTFLPQSGDTSEIISTDAGPANTLIDAAVREYFQMDFDKDGMIARSGRVNEHLLHELLEHPFFEKELPKSTGPELFNLSFVNEAIHRTGVQLVPEDLVATLSRFTAEVIAKTIKKHFNLSNTSIYASGGGSNNVFLREQIQSLLPGFNLKPLDALGIYPDAKEAVLFAVLANEALMGEPLKLGNLPAIGMGKLSFPY